MEKLNFLLTQHPHLSGNWMWGIFIIVIFTLLFLDLCVFHRHAEEPKISETFKLSAYYIIIALIFGLFVIYERGMSAGMLYYTGYLVEKSLSIDNIFVISIVFSSLKVPAKHQHRVLFWGVLGAIIMRAIMIMLGAQLVSNFHWVLYIFSLFLIYTGMKMLMMKGDGSQLQEGKLFSFIQKRFNVTKELHGEHFFIKQGHKNFITPLFFALIIIEIMDVIFAVDSIPAIFLITQDVFIIYTSNIFAILGLRSLYFLLAAAVNRFAYLKPALALILIFIGAKIFTPYAGLEVQPSHSLIVTFSILAGGIGFSLIKTRKHQ